MNDVCFRRIEFAQQIALINDGDTEFKNKFSLNYYFAVLQSWNFVIGSCNFRIFVLRKKKLLFCERKIWARFFSSKDKDILLSSFSSENCVFQKILKKYQSSNINKYCPRITRLRCCVSQESSCNCQSKEIERGVFNVKVWRR